MTINMSDESGLPKVAADIIDFAQDKKVWLFDGSMGAGKTTLIKAICDQMEVVDETSSPTFALVNVYENSAGEELYHFDFYRIDDEREAVDIGTDEYLYSGNYCFIEWSEKIPNLIPEEYLRISIKLGESNQRIVELSHHD